MIKTLDVTQYARWDQFVNNTDEATFFHLWVGRRLLKKPLATKRIFFIPNKMAKSPEFYR